MRVLGLSAILPAAATFYFFVFWRWFDYWRRHRVQTYALMFLSFAALGGTVELFDELVYRRRIAPPDVVRIAGYVLIGVASVAALIADRQIGFRVRSFTPFFEPAGRIRLRTTGAYGVVRHPIYAAGIAYQLGVFLVTGYVAVLVACVVFALGAAWFTRQEEERLIQLLDDPIEYERYRARVPALVPWLKRSPRRE